jgi:superfamily I DNA and/or RNA helicase
MRECAHTARPLVVFAVSCVRSVARGAMDAAGDTIGSGTIGFLDDTQRMNVALTRAKYALWVVGSRRALSVSKHWSAFLGHARDRNAIVDVDNVLCDVERLRPSESTY